MHEKDRRSTDKPFAYTDGTLQHPAIVKRVLGRNIDQLEFQPAVLANFARHKVAGADYPAIVSAGQSAQIRGLTVLEDAVEVQGVTCKGLSAKDVSFLDAFEGDEYGRVVCSVAQKADLSQSILCYVYVWIAELKALDPEIWVYEDFIRDKLANWVGTAQSEVEYQEADRLREAASTVQKRLTEERNGHA